MSTPPTAPPAFNLARFDLISIRLVVLCADSGSLGEASRIAHMSKSTASQRLANFESTLGHPLFVRDHRGLHATEAGLIVASFGRTIINSVRELTAQLGTDHQ